LRSSETYNIALIHSLLNELVKGYAVRTSNSHLQMRLDALRRLANPSSGLAQTAIWQSINRLVDFDQVNASVMDTLARHIQGECVVLVGVGGPSTQLPLFCSLGDFGA
jgi:hypothetical protein